jgi:hypothetical protein
VQDGTANLSGVQISGGGYFSNISSYPMTNSESAVLWFDSAQVTMNDVTISNARRPGGTLYAENTNLSISNSNFGWDEPYEKTYDTWFDNGIKVRNSTLHIDNVNFKKMNTALSIYDGSTFTYDNFGPQNFIDPFHTQYKNWQPADLLDFELFGTDEEDVVEEVIVEELVEVQ